MFSDKELDKKALEYQEIIEKHIVQKKGMIPMLVKPGTYELPTAEDYKGAYRHRHLKGKTEEELGLPPMHVWRAWENTTANTGFYLGALAYQYRCTRDEKVLKMCSRTLRALEYIYDLGVENGRPGFMCKPYGGVYTNQTSGDQVQCLVQGLIAYMEIAPKEDYDIIKKIAVGMAEWEFKINFIPPAGSYFAWEWEDEEWIKIFSNGIGHSMIYIPLLLMAWNFTGNSKYVEKISQWYSTVEWDYYKKNPPTYKGIKEGGGHEPRSLYLPSTLMKMDPMHQDYWRSMIARYKVTIKGILEDGMIYSQFTHNFDTGETILGEYVTGGIPTKTGRSAIIARGLVDAQQWHDGEEMAEKAYLIISRMGLNEFRFIASIPGEKPLPESYRIEENLVDTDGLTSWLWTYWEGKWFRYW